MKMICEAKRNGECDRNSNMHCTEHEKTERCTLTCSRVNSVCVPVEERTCETCRYEIGYDLAFCCHCPTQSPTKWHIKGTECDSCYDGLSQWQPKQTKTCKTCRFSLGNNGTGKLCDGKGCVDYSGWKPVVERTCKTCACVVSSCGGVAKGCYRPEYKYWQPKPPCSTCEHTYKRKFEPIDIGFCIDTEEELRIVKAFVKKWTNADGSIYWAVPRILRDQLKDHGIEND